MGGETLRMGYSLPDQSCSIPGIRMIPERKSTGGDVVRFTTGREDSKVFIGVVEFYQGCFAICFEFPLGGRYINTGWVSSLNTVLGNMYENPELLSQCGELVK